MGPLRSLEKEDLVSITGRLPGLGRIALNLNVLRGSSPRCVLSQVPKPELNDAALVAEIVTWSDEDRAKLKRGGTVKSHSW